MRVLAETPYLRQLALLVLLGTTSAALIDYLFKAQAVVDIRNRGKPAQILRHVLCGHAASSRSPCKPRLSRLALEHMGLALTTATPSLALVAGSRGRTGRAGTRERDGRARRGDRCSATRCSARPMRCSTHRFRPAKSARRNRLSTSASTVWAMRSAAAPSASSCCWRPRAAHGDHGLDVLGAAAGAFVASRLNRGYIQTLERNLRDRADRSRSFRRPRSDDADGDIELDVAVARRIAASMSPWSPRPPTWPDPEPRQAEHAGPEMQDIMSAAIARPRSRLVGASPRTKSLTPALIPHVIPLLAWDPVADDAIASLRQIAPRHVGKLADALLDPYEEFAVRRRIPRVLSVCRSQRAVDSLLLGLDGHPVRSPLPVRTRAGHDRDRARRTCASTLLVSSRWCRKRWRSVAPCGKDGTCSIGLDEGDADTFVDEFIRNRATRSLAHVFTLLSLVLPAEPLQIALRGLYVEDQNLRGTALEYLESVLPPVVREPLWPFLEDRRGARPSRGHDDIVADLVRSNHSIMLNLKELKRRAEAAEGKKREGQPT